MLVVNPLTWLPCERFSMISLDLPPGSATPSSSAPGLNAPEPGAPALRRSLKLWHAVLYGLGVTVGAGIYVLIADTAGRAGMHAPLSFVFTAAMIGFTGASLAELGSRFPVAAGEAEYVRRGFRSEAMAAVIGLLVIAMAILSSATISIGAAGYIGVFVPLPETVLIAIVVLAMGAIAARGIVESVTFAGLMTLIELGGLTMIVATGFATSSDVVTRLPEVIPATLDPAVWSGIVSASLLAVFAFVGFEGIVNLGEELEEPERNLPRAILLTLAITTALYVLVAWVSLVAMGPRELAAAKAPLAAVFERLTGGSPLTMSAIAVVATLNGIVVNLIMASRVMYGLSRTGTLPAALAAVNVATGTPVLATGLATLIALLLALALPLAHLADLSARITLVVFGLVNLALLLLKRRDARAAPAGPQAGPEGEAEARHFACPMWVPVAGVVSCAGFLAADFAIAVMR